MLNFLRKTFLWIVLLPFAVGGLGTILNQACLIANNDQFPVRGNIVHQVHWLSKPGVLELNEINQRLYPKSPVLIDDESHILMSDKTHLNWLGDNFDFKEEGIYSIGDILVDWGGELVEYCFIIWFVLAIKKLAKN